MRALIVGICMVLAGCASTNPQNGAAISYALPRTDAKLAVDLTLRSCDSDPKLTADAELSLIPVAGAQAERYAILGETLASARIKRSFKLTVSDQGVITGINSENEDQSPQILENVLKTATTIVGALGRPLVQDPDKLADEASLRCTDEVRDAATRSAWLKLRIAQLRGALASVKTRDDPALVKQINLFAREKAALDTGILHIQLTAPLKLDDFVGDVKTINDSNWTSQTSVPLDADPFIQWFGPAKPSSDPKIPSAREKLLNAAFGLHWAASWGDVPTITTQPIPHAANTSRECGFAIAIPAPRKLDLVVHGTGSALPDGSTASKALYAAQTQSPASLCLDVGFGESRSVALSFDEFGRTTTFEWSSNATAVSGSAAIAGLVSTADSLRSSLEGPSAIEAQEAEIKRLETQQRLNELKACEAIIKSGGFECKPAAD